MANILDNSTVGGTTINAADNTGYDIVGGGNTVGLNYHVRPTDNVGYVKSIDYITQMFPPVGGPAGSGGSLVNSSNQYGSYQQVNNRWYAISDYVYDLHGSGFRQGAIHVYTHDGVGAGPTITSATSATATLNGTYTGYPNQWAMSGDYIIWNDSTDTAAIYRKTHIVSGETLAWHIDNSTQLDLRNIAASESIVVLYDYKTCFGTPQLKVLSAATGEDLDTSHYIDQVIKTADYEATGYNHPYTVVVNDRWIVITLDGYKSIGGSVYTHPKLFVFEYEYDPYASAKFKVVFRGGRDLRADVLGSAYNNTEYCNPFGPGDLKGDLYAFGMDDTSITGETVYVLDLTCMQYTHIIPNPNLNTYSIQDGWGYSVAFMGKTLLIGAPFEDSSSKSSNAGRIVLYDLSTSTIETSTVADIYGGPIANNVGDQLGKSLLSCGDKLFVTSTTMDWYDLWSMDGSGFILKTRSPDAILAKILSSR